MPRRRRHGKWSCRERDGKVRCVPMDERLKSRAESYRNRFGNLNSGNKANPLIECSCNPKEKNVLFGNNRGDRDQLESPQSWEHYDYDLHYGTHDLLADIALSVHKSNYQFKYPSGQNFWTEERRKIFLYATEAPDKPKTQYKGTYFMLTENPNYIRFPTENEVLTELPEADDTFMRRFHLLQFDAQKNVKKEINWFARPFDTFLKISCEENAATRAQFWYEKGLDLFNEDKEYDGAAFCFGVMAHYISDVACFYHVIDPFQGHVQDIKTRKITPEDIFMDFIIQHFHFEKLILLRTNSIGPNRKYSIKENVRSKFFQFNEKRLRSLAVNEFADAKTATEKVARSTAFGDPSARDLCDYYNDYYNELVWRDPSLQDDRWPENHYGNRSLDWHLNNELDSRLHQFLIRNEEILNYAITQISCVLNRISIELKMKY